METIPFLNYSLYEMFHMFIFWSFIGWCIEICYITLETGEYQNRGFLRGPICPIYGFGVLMVVIFFRPLEDTYFLLFVVSALLCTLFELSVGIGMEKLLNNRWWDYSHEKFNFKGYICLKVSLLWGLGCVLVVKAVHPIVEKYVGWLPVRLGIVIIVIISVLIVIDFSSSISAVNNLNIRLKQIDELSNIILKSAVIIGGNLSNETLEIKSRYNKLIEAADNKTSSIKDKYDIKSNELREKYDNVSQELREKFDKLTNIRDTTIERWVKSFPNMHSVSYNDSFDKIKAVIKKRTGAVKRIKEKITKN